MRPVFYKTVDDYDIVSYKIISMVVFGCFCNENGVD